MNLLPNKIKKLENREKGLLSSLEKRSALNEELKKELAKYEDMLQLNKITQEKLKEITTPSETFSGVISKSKELLKKIKKDNDNKEYLSADDSQESNRDDRDYSDEIQSNRLIDSKDFKDFTATAKNQVI